MRIAAFASRFTWLFAWAVAQVCVAGPAPDAAREDLLEAAERAEAARIATIERIAPAVVCIFDEKRRGGGSGVIIDEAGYGLTNYHVVAGMLDTRKGLGGLPDGNLYELQVLGIDPGGDVAMFKLNGRDTFPYAMLGDSDRVQPGDLAIAMGNPFVLSDDYTPTVTLGIVSGVHRYQKGSGDALLYSDCIQVDTSINPGNSGGPLFNSAGEIVGINGRISVSMRGRLNVGLGYAITSNQIKPFIPGLRAGLLVPHGSLQCVMRDDAEGRVICFELLEKAPAWNAGMRPGDRLLRFDGREVTSANRFASLLGTLPADWPTAISFEKPDGTILHRVVRTEAVRTKVGDKFEPDQNQGMVQARRLVQAFVEHGKPFSKSPAPTEPLVWVVERLSAGAVTGATEYAVTNDPDSGLLTPTDSTESALQFDVEKAVRITPGGEEPLPTDLALAYRLVFLLERMLLGSADELRIFRHGGADRLLEIDEHGRIMQSRLLEVLRAQLGSHATVDFQFDADTQQLLRIVATDRPTGERVELTLDGDNPATAVIHARLFNGELIIHRRKDAESPPTGTDSAGLAESAGPPALPGLDPQLIDHVNERVLKLIGAKAGRAEGYGSGIIISPEGLVLTVDSILLDSMNIRAYLSDGTRRLAEVVYADRSQQLALLQLEVPAVNELSGASTNGYPHFELDESAEASVGQWVLAAGNPFKVAEGAEPISFSMGVLSDTSKLDAVRGTLDFPYRGDVLITDAITSTPGFSGGALVDIEGRLLGMIGRVVEARATATNVNHAIPNRVLARFVELAQDPEARRQQAASDQASAGQVHHGIKFFELGYRSNPVYVERVARNSPAARAGLRKDDLIVGANGKPVANLEALERIIAGCGPGETLELTVMRNEQLHKVTIELEAAK